jgi:hypothetical protein
MAKPGHLAGLLAAGYDLSQFFNSIQTTESVEEADVTTFPPLGTIKTYKDYKPMLSYATMQLGGFFDVDQSGTTHDGLDDILAAALGPNAGQRLVCALPFGDGFGNQVDAMQADETSYTVTAAAQAMVTAQAQFQSRKNCVESLEVLLPLAAVTAAPTNGADLDAGASYSSLLWTGGVAYLHVTAATALTSATVKVQHSVDGTTWVDLITFAAVTARHTSQRAEFTGTVNRHVRAIVSALTGTSVTVHVAFGRTPK